MLLCGCETRMLQVESSPREQPNEADYSLILTSTHGSVHSLRPTRLRNQPNPMPVSSDSILDPVVAKIEFVNLLFTPSNAASSNAAAVLLETSAKNPPILIFPCSTVVTD